ncbi:MAG: hypothetical protein M1828_000731 [Chrysothrix sp. TS-e1954]|nr:MAG: hypothetical protein M1828_000731 [Chrysothrix sp. TS-e1954]
MLSEHLQQQCQSPDSISSGLAISPDRSPGDISKEMYDSHNLVDVEAKMPKERGIASGTDLELVRKCGNFGDTKPSELFLRTFGDVLLTLEKDRVAGAVSPSLIGTTGVVPFAVIGPLHDVVRHMSNLIVRAEKEVLLATNYWMASDATRLITDALLELSKRAGARGQKIPVKIMYDRGNVKQVFDNHQPVGQSEYTGKSIKIPPPEEIPNIDLSVVNFHRPMLGTFHAKFMIVDRQIAITQSNNIQDNDNVEMMAQLEGPIVDSLWETFLLSWHNSIQPLNCINERAADKPAPTFLQESFKDLLTPEGIFKLPDVKQYDSSLPEHMPGDPQYDVDVAGEINRMHSMLSPKTADETRPECIARHLNIPTKLSLAATAPAIDPPQHFFPFIPIPPHAPVPIALVSRKPHGTPLHNSLHVPQNAAFLSVIAHARHSIFIQTPDLNASPLYEALLSALRRGIDVTYYVCLGYNDAGELLPGQNGTNEMFANSLYSALRTDATGDQAAQDAAVERLTIHYYVAADQVRPIHNKFKQRSCHIKLLIADSHLAIQGSGNQDTQSWWQSQEVNVMIDSAVVCKAWREGIERNQNTRQYGMASRRDGCWYDSEGKLAEGSLGTDPGKFAWAKGIVGAVNRARGAGGF